MSKIYSFIKDVLEEFSIAYKYADLDFYKLRYEVIALLNNAKANGYGYPDYCSLAINVKNRFETDIEIEAYYKKYNGKFQRFKKNIDVGNLSNIPCVVKKRLDSFKEVAIKLSDFNSLYSISDDNIIPMVDFNNIYKFTLKNAKGIPVKKELHITDELFYYKVVMVYVYENGEKEMRVKYFGNIKEMPIEVIDKITSNDGNSCSMDVTNSNI